MAARISFQEDSGAAYGINTVYLNGIQFIIKCALRLIGILLRRAMQYLKIDMGKIFVSHTHGPLAAHMLIMLIINEHIIKNTPIPIANDTISFDRTRANHNWGRILPDDCPEFYRR